MSLPLRYQRVVSGGKECSEERKNSSFFFFFKKNCTARTKTKQQTTEQEARRGERLARRRAKEGTRGQTKTFSVQIKKKQQEIVLKRAHPSLQTLTVREVKVRHMPPKPLKVRAMKIRTESSAQGTQNTETNRGCERRRELSCCEEHGGGTLHSPFGL